MPPTTPIKTRLCHATKLALTEAMKQARAGFRYEFRSTSVGKTVSEAKICHGERDGLLPRFAPLLVRGGSKSHAYGQPHADSDVDILVVMPARNQLDQAAKIHLATLPPFPVHLLVRTPRNLAWRLAAGDSFLKEIVSKGKVLYEKVDQGMGRQGRSRLPGRRHVKSRSTARA